MSSEEKESHRHGLYYVIPSSIMDDERLSPTDIVLYALLSGLADQDGKCFPSDAYIGKRLHLTTDGAKKAIKRLADIGLIDRQTQRCPSNPFKSIRIILVHKELKKRSRSVMDYPPEGVATQYTPEGVMDYPPGVDSFTPIESEAILVSEDRTICPLTVSQPYLSSEPVRTQKKRSRAGANPISLDLPNRKFEGIQESDIEAWKALYPHLDIPHQIKKCMEWAIANPRNNYRKSITTWLSNASISELARKSASQSIPQNYGSPIDRRMRNADGTPRNPEYDNLW